MVNETSVELLNLDASEFAISDREMITLQSEEFLADTNQHVHLNSTFQYIVGGQDKVCGATLHNCGVLSADGKFKVLDGVTLSKEQS